MQNPNAIVSRTVRLDPPLERPPAEMLREDRGVSVVLDGDRRARLDPANPASPGFAQVLDGLSRQQRPVYLEVDPATSYVTRVLIPHVTRVVGMSRGPDGIDVELEMSHARHVLPAGTPDAAELEARLRESLERGSLVIVTEDDRHNIIDVRGFTPGPDSPLPPLPPFPRPELPKWPWPFGWLRDLLLRLWRWPCWPWWWFHPRCMSSAYAQQVFDAMAATTCTPLTVPPPCIPFMYPDDGCWGRAHEMCRLMALMGVLPRKVWIQRVAPGYLHVDTRNNPNCFVEWNWHVAPTVCVRRRRWWFCPWSQEMVIDPSMFTTPVTKAAWKAAQNNPGATLTDSDWTIFYLWGSITDPTFAQTNSVLATYRLQLQLRSQGPAGPPPYAHCP
ncbi:MAG TPA: protein-glutamine glutaminase family protein [Longimicrobiales bacterium]